MNKFKKPKSSMGLFSDKKEVEKYYNIVKSNIDSEDGGIDANVFKYLKEILPKDFKEQLVLDIGCGDARWSEYMLKRNAQKVYAIDKDPKAISLSKTRKEQSNLENLEVIQADMNNLPIEKETIDKVLSSFSLMYFDNLEDVISEVSRTLKNGGEFYITTNIIHIDDPQLKQALKGKKIDLALGLDNDVVVRPNVYQPLEQYKDAFNKAGFKINDEKYFEPEGVAVSSECKYRDDITLKKAVFKLIKTKNTQNQ